LVAARSAVAPTDRLGRALPQEVDLGRRVDRVIRGCWAMTRGSFTKSTGMSATAGFSWRKSYRRRAPGGIPARSAPRWGPSRSLPGWSPCPGDPFRDQTRDGEVDLVGDGRGELMWRSRSPWRPSRQSRCGWRASGGHARRPGDRPPAPRRPTRRRDRRSRVGPPGPCRDRCGRAPPLEEAGPASRSPCRKRSRQPVKARCRSVSRVAEGGARPLRLQSAREARAWVRPVELSADVQQARGG